MTDTPESAAGRFMRRMPSWPTLAWVALVGIVSVVSVLLRWRVPITTGASLADDALYVRLAGYLAHGQWLGPFDQFTLLKGPAYPAFIALTYRWGVPLKIGEQLTYLFAAAAVAGCIWVVTRRRALALVAYVVLALDPVNFDTHGSRVTRDGWYSSLSLLFVALFFLAIYLAVTRTRPHWLVLFSALAGLSGAAFWLCREEGAWIIPMLLLVAVGLPLCVLVRWWSKRPRPPGRSRVLRGAGRLGLAFAVVAVALIAPIAAISVQNSRHYGAALTNDLVSGQFARAYADWRRVKAGLPSAADPIVGAQREAVYRVSPAARELERFLDPPGRCLKPCGENVWRAVRDAAALAGHFRSEADAQAFFGELDAQIQAGCESGQLSCRGRLPTQLQSLQFFSADPFFAYLRRWGGKTLTTTGFNEIPNEVRWLKPDRREPFTQIVSGLPLSQSAADEQMSRFIATRWRYRLLSRIYRLVIPCLLVMGLIGLLWPIVRPRWPQVGLSVLAGAFVVGALSRLVLVALLNTTQFLTQGSDIRYLLPAHTFLIGFAVVGTAQLADAIWTRVLLHRGDGQAVPPEPPLVASQPADSEATPL